MKTILSIFICSLVLVAAQAQKTKLALDLKKGQVYYQVSDAQTNITQEVNGQKMDMQMHVTGAMKFLVTAVNADDYDMEASFTRLGMDMQMPQGNVQFDSEKNDPNDAFSSILGAMKNQAFEVKMKKNGKVVAVKNAETLWNAAIDQFDELPEMQRQQMKNQIMQAYGNDALKGNIEMVTAIFPDKAARPGDHWTIQTNLEAGFAAILETDYELTEVGSDYVVIKGNSKLKTEDKDAYIESNGMPMKYDLSGTMASEIKVDKQSGWIIDAKINQEVSGDTYIKENPQVPNGMKIPMTLKSEMHITDME